MTSNHILDRAIELLALHLLSIDDNDPLITEPLDIRDDDYITLISILSDTYFNTLDNCMTAMLSLNDELNSISLIILYSRDDAQTITNLIAEIDTDLMMIPIP